MRWEFRCLLLNLVHSFSVQGFAGGSLSGNRIGEIQLLVFILFLFYRWWMVHVREARLCASAHQDCSQHWHHSVQTLACSYSNVDIFLINVPCDFILTWFWQNDREPHCVCSFTVLLGKNGALHLVKDFGFSIHFVNVLIPLAAKHPHSLMLIPPTC